MNNAQNKADGRFFPGYIWTSLQPDCMNGLCFKSDDERVAADRMAPFQYWMKGQTFIVFTKTQPYDVPQRHTIIR